MVAFRDKEKERAYKRAWYLANREKKYLSKEAIERRTTYAKANPEVGERATRAWVKRNPEKKRAHWALKDAVKVGKIVRPSVCSRCGSEGPIHAHHPDYSKPLEVEFICSSCHGKQHRMEQHT